eukprot:scaffold2229_cov413-Prasinococcus_capsulatus_cf.AAC.12
MIPCLLQLAGKYPVELSTKILLGALCLMFNCVGMLAAGLTKFRGSERYATVHAQVIIGDTVATSVGGQQLTLA